jgi:hypothetical protein
VAPNQPRTHPPKNDRLAAVGSGWSKSCDNDPRCSTPPSQSAPSARSNSPSSSFPNSDSSASRQPRRQLEADTTGPNSCEFANDGECDEPNLCERGTDTNDCRGSRRRPSSPRAAEVCSTIFGACPMMEAIPPGSSCTCFTAFGPVAGVSR